MLNDIFHIRRVALLICVIFAVESAAFLTMKRGASSRGESGQRGGKKQARKGGKVDERSERPLDAYYFTEDGLRHVKPYTYSFSTYAKGRWLGRSLLDVFVAEFAAHPPSYYAAAIAQGRITVNGAAVEASYLVRNGDALMHRTHRHEPPVMGCAEGELEIVADTSDLLVVNKPSTVAMHPCGAYRYNSLFHILDAERKATKAAAVAHGKDEAEAEVNEEALHIVHRLDRLTSGLTLFAKSPEVAKRFSDDLQAGSTAKAYLARVMGDFGTGFLGMSAWQRPASLLKANERQLGWCLEEGELTETGALSDKETKADVGVNGSESLSSLVEEASRKVREGSEVRVQQSISCVSHKDGVYMCAYASDPQYMCSTSALAPECLDQEAKEAKAATTVFRKLSFNGVSSVVECRPVHGRTHQLRLHLQFLGHPIANDPCYGGTLHYGSHGIPTEDPLLSTRITGEASTSTSTILGEAFTPEAVAAATAAAPTTAGDSTNENQGNTSSSNAQDEEWCTRPQEPGESEDAFMVRTCPFCHQGRRKAAQRLANAAADPSSSSLLDSGSGSSSGSGIASGGVTAADEVAAGESADTGAVGEEARVGFRDAELAAFGEETLHCAGIWLHALRYTRKDPVNSEKDWAFETSMPLWADEGFKEES